MIKKFLMMTAVAGFLIACGGNDANNNTATDASGTKQLPQAPAAVNTGISEAEADEGLTLVGGSDCLACHKVEDRIVGPSYKEVANKYPISDSTFNYLAAKIIEGGSGVWGQQVMTPHPTLSKEDAVKMAKYVMSLKDNQ